MTELFAETNGTTTTPFKIASGMASMEAQPEPLAETTIANTSIDPAAFSSTLDYATRSLKEAGVRKEEFDPDGMEILGAAFRQGNTIGSALASKSLAEKLFPSIEDKILTDEELIDRVKADGMADHLDNFRDVFTQKAYEARKSDIERETEDRQILAASGFTGVSASLAAGILDLPTLVPVSRIATIGKVANTLKATTQGAAAATIDAVATEGVLQSTQQLRTAEESAINIGSATVLGGMLGFSVHKAFGNEIGDKVVAGLDDLRSDAATGFQGSRDAGAKALSVYDQIKERNLNSTAPVFSAGAFTTLKGLGNIGQGPIAQSSVGQAAGLPKLLGFLGDNLRNPRIDLENGMTPEERSFVSQMTFSPSISVMQAEGAAKLEVGGSVGSEAPINVANVISKFQGEYVQSVHQIENLYRKNSTTYKNVDDFSERVAKAMASGDQSSDPVVQQAAEIARARVLEPIRKQLVQNGNFKEEMTPRNASSYFPLVHDTDRIRADAEAWKEYHTSAFLRDIQEEFRTAKVEQDVRRSDRADVKIEARTGKRSDIDTLKTEHKVTITTLRADRKKAVDEFDISAKSRRDALDDKPKSRTKLEVKVSRERNDITTRFNELERKAREQRDEGLAAAQTKAVETNEAASDLSSKKGLGALRYSTLEKQEIEAIKRADDFYNAVTGNKRYVLDHEVMGSTAGFRKFRSNPAWHVTSMERGWVKTNIFDILEHYTRNAGTDASIGTVFKKNLVVKNADGLDETVAIGDIGLTEPAAAIRNSYNKLIGSSRFDEPAKLGNAARAYANDPAKIVKRQEKIKAEGAALELKLVNARDRAVSNVEALHRFAKGQDLADGTSDSFRNAAEVMGAFNFLRLMGGTVASSLGDPVNLVIANGFGRTMKFGLLPLLKDFGAAMKNADGDLRRLSRLAMANAEIELNSRIGLMADIGNPYAKATPAVTFTRNASKTFSKATGITFWNSFWKQVSFNTTQGRIVQNALVGWETASKAERAWMLNLGINENGLAKIKSAFDGQEGSKFVDGTDLPIAAFDKWADQEAGELVRSAAYAESHNAVVTPHFSDKMRLTGTPIGRLIFQFRSFMIANQMKVIGRNIQLASIDDAGSKRAGVYTGLFGLAMAGAMVDATKHMLGNTTITGSSLDADHSSFDRVLREWEQTPGNALYNALDRSSMFGIVFEGSNMLDKMGLPNIRGGITNVLGDDPGVGRGGSARFANRGVFESVMGPTAGLIEDGAKVGSFLTGMGDAYLGSHEGSTFNRSDFRRVRRLLPGQSAPVVQQILNEGEAQMGTIFDWPSPQ